MTTEALKEKMDRAAEEAATELDNMDEEAIKPLGDWVLQFYERAGWKRLGRLVREKLEGDLPAVLEGRHHTPALVINRPAKVGSGFTKAGLGDNDA